MIPGLAFSLGRLIDIHHVYQVQSEGQKAKAKRPRKKNLLKQKLISVLAIHRKQNMSLLESLRAMKNDDEGFRVEDMGDSLDYLVVFDAPDGELLQKVYKFKSLQALFTVVKKR